MAHYRVSFRIDGKLYNTIGDSTYPSDEAIENKDIDMDIAMESAAVIASAYKSMSHLEGNIESNSISFDIFK